MKTLLSLILITVATVTSGQAFLPVDEAMQVSAYRSGDELVVEWTIAPEHYMYRDVTRFGLVQPDSSATLGSPVLSNHEEVIYDPTFEEDLAVYHDFLTARVPVTSDRPVDIRVTYQGCAEAGLCYPPQTRTIRYAPTGDAQVMSEQGPVPSDPERPTETSAAGAGIAWDSASLAGFLGASGVGWSMLVFLGLGIALVFTPCVLPMIPIASALVLGDRRPGTPKALLVASSYVLGMALTYAVLGVTAARLGAAGNFQAAMQQPWVLSVFAGLFSALALAMFGLFNLQTPGPLQNRLTAMQNRLQQGRVGSAFGVGSLSALVVSPCVTAPLAGALIYLSVSGNLVNGFLSLFALGVGMGLPLIVITVGGARWLPSTGPWMTQVRVAFGVLLLAIAVWLLSRWIAPALALILWGGLALGYGSWWLRQGRTNWLARALGIAIMLYGGAALLGGFGGQSDPLRPLNLSGSDARPAEAGSLFFTTSSPETLERRIVVAQEAGEPVFLDVTADWCISCKVMEREIYLQADVQRRMQAYRWVRLDITGFTPAHQSWLDRYGLFGPPAVMVFDADRSREPVHSLQGELSRERFLRRLGLP